MPVISWYFRWCPQHLDNYVCFVSLGTALVPEVAIIFCESWTCGQTFCALWDTLCGNFGVPVPPGGHLGSFWGPRRPLVDSGRQMHEQGVKKTPWWETIWDPLRNFFQQCVALIWRSGYFIVFCVICGALPEFLVCIMYTPVWSKHTSLFLHLCPKQHHIGLHFRVILEPQGGSGCTCAINKDAVLGRPICGSVFLVTPGACRVTYVPC